MRRALLAPVALVLGLWAGGCSDDPAPAEIRFSRAALAFDAVGDSALVLATVIDEEGKEMRGRTVEWSSNDPGVARVSTAGMVTAVGPGSGSILATDGKASATLPVSVIPIPATLQVVSGREQTGVAGEPLPEPLVVEARDRLGTPVVQADLEVEVQFGGGEASSTALVTGLDGRAQVTWTLGPQAGTVHQIRIGVVDRQLVAAFVVAEAVAGPAARVELISGGGQVGLPGASLPAPLRFRVSDRFGNPREGDTLAVAVAAGGGTVDPARALTDSLGNAEFAWTLGEQGGEQRLSATTGTVETQASATALSDPARLRIVQGAAVSGVVGEAVPDPLAVRLEDAAGFGIPGVPVRLRIPEGDGGVADAPGGDPAAEVLAVTDGDGVATVGAWVLGTTAGPQELEASFPGLDPVRFQATALPGAPAVLEPGSGDFQVGPVLAPLPEELLARVVDRFGNPVPGEPVDFLVSGGGGTVAVTRGVTDAAGTAAAAWTLGPVLGLQVLAASSPGLAPVSLHAAGLPVIAGDYDVEVEFLVPVTPETWAAFHLAAGRWRRVIVEDLPDVLADVPAGQCGSGSPAVRGVVDDVRVLITVVPIDGVGGTLGSAGPCWIRSGSELPFLGRIRLDSADLDRMAERGILVDLITHEIGHVLGVGSLWRRFELLQDPSLDTPGADTYFSGAAAITAFDAAGGASYTGAKVPVENQNGGAGTQDVHWRESVMDLELMTGYIDNLGNPLSAVTGASLQDMGYVVDLTGVDNWSLAPGLPGIRDRERILLENDVLWLPLRSAPAVGRR